MVFYADNTTRRFDFQTPGEPAYRARVRYANGSEQELVSLERCFNPAMAGIRMTTGEGGQFITDGTVPSPNPGGNPPPSKKFPWILAIAVVVFLALMTLALIARARRNRRILLLEAKPVADPPAETEEAATSPAPPETLLETAEGKIGGMLVVSGPVEDDSLDRTTTPLKLPEAVAEAESEPLAFTFKKGVLRMGNVEADLRLGKVAVGQNGEIKLLGMAAKNPSGFSIFSLNEKGEFRIENGDATFLKKGSVIEGIVKSDGNVLFAPPPERKPRAPRNTDELKEGIETSEPASSLTN